MATADRGISGSLGGLLGAGGSDSGWRLAFLVGPLVATLGYAAVAGPPAIVVTAGPGAIVAAGLLVGFATRLGGGCTSGHGVCGIARLSTRSIVATGSCMATAADTVFIVRHVVGG